jgi:hypothetical protein
VFWENAFDEDIDPLQVVYEIEKALPLPRNQLMVNTPDIPNRVPSRTTMKVSTLNKWDYIAYYKFFTYACALLIIIPTMTFQVMMRTCIQKFVAMGNLIKIRTMKGQMKILDWALAT